MGRPKLYATPEERVLAARSYQAKYYAKYVIYASRIDRSLNVQKSSGHQQEAL